MNLQQAIEIIDNIIAGVNCNRQQRRTIEDAFATIINATKKKPDKDKSLLKTETVNMQKK